MKNIFRALVFGLLSGIVIGLGLAEYQKWREEEAFRNHPLIKNAMAEHYGRKILEQRLETQEEV